MPISQGTRLGPYEILAPLGAGGMGEVYRARDTRLGREVAVKVLPTGVSMDPDRLKRFEKEARSASSLNHPNIVTIYDIGESGGTSFIAMELVEGQTVRDLLAAGALPAKRILAIAAQAADGLAKAHGAGIVHRDLKPENVMVTKDGFVKILDFGLAKLTQPEAPEGQETHAPTVSAGTEPGVVMGTVGYMSPEQASGLPLDFRSDQFSFGSVMYEMATGKAAFQGRTRPEILAAIIREEPEPMTSLAPKTPVPIRWVVERCLAKEPRERYSSTEDLARDLGNLREHISEAGASGGALAAEPARRGLRLSPAILGAAVSAAALLGALLGWWALRASASPAPTFQRLTFRRGNIAGARFAPDGQTIVFAAAWDGDPLQVFTTRPGATESRALGLSPANLLAISSAGEMALLLDPQAAGGPVHVGTLARAPLAGGAAREVLDHVQDADWSPDGKELVIVREVGAHVRLEYPPGKVLSELSSEGAFLWPRVSPTGDKVVVLAYADRTSSPQVVVLDRSGRKTMQMEHGTWGGFGWSSKGDEIWLCGPQLSAITLSGKERLLYASPIRLALHDLAHDGRVLVSGGQYRRGMIALAPGETAERDLSWLDGSQVSDLSADGKTLLFDESEEGGGPNESVYLRKTDGSAAVRLGEGWATSLTVDGKWALTIPPEGTKLVLLPTGVGETRTATYHAIETVLAAWPFPDGERVLIRAIEKGHGARLYVGALGGGSLRPITPEGIDFHGVAITPDGKWVTAIRSDRMAMFYSVEGGAGVSPHQVAGLSAGDVPIRFASDGASLFVYRLDESPAKILRLDLATGRKDLWKVLAPSDRAGADALRPVRITPDGKSYAYSFVRALEDLYLVKGLK